MQVTIVNVNDPPTIGACTDRSIAEGSAIGSAVGSPLTVSDSDFGQQETFSITSLTPVASPAPFTIGGCSGVILVNALFSYSFASSYTVGLLVTDSGGLTSSCSLHINILHVNHAPVIFGASFTISENLPVGALVGFVSVSDPDGDTMVYTVSRPDTPNAFTVDGAKAMRVLQACYSGCTAPCSSTCSTLDYESKKTFTMDVTATDSFGAFNTATFTITITNVDDPPVVYNHFASVNEMSPSGTLFGNLLVATDQDAGDVITWSISDPYGVFGVVAATGRLKIAVTDNTHLNYLTYPVLTASITARDTAGATATASLTVNMVFVNTPPAVANQVRSLIEGVSLGSVIAGPIVATSRNPSATLYYQLIAGTSGNIAISATTGVMSTSGPVDFETKSTYTMTVQVTDNGIPPLSSTAIVTVNLVDVNDPPSINTTVQYSVLEYGAAGTVVGNIRILDQDAGDVARHVVSIYDGNQGTAFSLSSTTPYALTVVNPMMLAYFVYPTFVMNIKVTDPAGAIGMGAITVRVIQVPQPCTFIRSDPSNIGPIVRSVKDGSVTGTTCGAPVVATNEDKALIPSLTYRIVSQPSPAYFQMDLHSGQVSLKTQLPGDGSVTDVTFSVSCTDPFSLISTTDSVQVLMSSVNNAPTEPNFVRVVAEECDSQTLVGLPVVGTDPDVGQTQTLTYTITAGNGAGVFLIGLNSAQIVTALRLNYETTPRHDLTITVTDHPTQDQTGYTAPALSASGVTTINLLDINEAPLFAASSYQRSVNENVPVNTPVGSPVTGLDVDSTDGFGTLLTYTLGTGNSGGAFAVNLNTGQIFVAKVVVDFEKIPQYSLQLIATDKGGLTAQTTVIVDVGNVNDLPIFYAILPMSIAENSPAGTAIGAPLTSMSYDQDVGGSLTFDITTGSVLDYLTIGSSSGQFKTVRTPSSLFWDFEAVPQYVLQVQATDNEGAIVTATVTVNILDVNEAPWYTGATNASIVENSAANTVLFVATYDDQDRGDSSTWAISGGNTYDTWKIDTFMGRVTVNDATKLDYEPLTTSFGVPQYRLVVTMKDRGGLSGSGTVAITVIDVNEVPTITTTFASVREDASAVGTLVGSQLQFQDQDFGQGHAITIASGDTTGLFSISGYQITVAMPFDPVTGTFSLNYEARQTYDLVLRIVDTGVPPLSSTLAFQVRLVDINESPIIPDNLIRAVAENAPANTPVGIELGVPDGPAHDPDVFMKQQLTFKIVSLDGNDGVFKVDACSGQLKVNVAMLGGVNMLDFELRSPVQIPPVYQLLVTVTDDGGADPGPANLATTGHVWVNVTDVNEPPMFPNGSVAYSLTVGENSFRVPSWLNTAAIGTGVGTPVVAHDPDWYTYENIVRYSITGGNAAGAFALDAVTGQLTVAGPIDFETTPGHAYVLTLRASDNGFNPDGTQSNLTTRGFGVGTVTITVLDVNEFPIVIPVTFSVPENCCPYFGSGSRSVAGQPAMGVNPAGSSNLVATDMDSGQTPTLVFAIVGGNAAGNFMLDNQYDAYSRNSRLAFTTTSALNFEAPRICTPACGVNVYALNISVTDAGTPPLTVYTIATVALTDVNEKPVILAQTRTVPENSPVGTPVGAPLFASDPDVYMHQMLYFGIVSGNTNNAFSLNLTSGQISVATPSALNYEVLDYFALTVTVSDGGLTDTALISINVINVNEVPVMVSQIQYVIDEEVPQLTMAQCTACMDPLYVDQDNVTLPAWSLGQVVPWAGNLAWGSDVLSIVAAPGDGSGNFTINGINGMMWVSLGGDIDYETQPAYHFIVRVTDGGGLYDQTTVTVMLRDIQEPPYFTTTTFYVAANAAVGTSISSLGGKDHDYADRFGLSYTIMSGFDMYYNSSGAAHAGNFSGSQFTSFFSLDGMTGYKNVDLTNASSQTTVNTGIGPQQSPGRLVVVRQDPVAFHFPNYFVLVVRLEDIAANRVTGEIRVQVADINTPPQLPSVRILMNEAVSFLPLPTAEINGQDYDDGQMISYSVQSIGTPFTIATAPGGWLRVSDSRTVNKGIIKILPSLRAQVNFQLQEVFVFNVVVQDDGSSIQPSYGDLTSDPPATITIALVNVNEPPYFLDKFNATLNSLSIPEYTPQFENIPGTSPIGSALGAGLVLYASDPDVKQGDPQLLVYSMGPRKAGQVLPFSINEKTGLILTTAQTDFETVNFYDIWLRVTDPGGLYVELLTTVRITDVNEASWMRNEYAVYTVVENSPPGTFVGWVLCGDVDFVPSGVPRFTYAVDAGLGWDAYFQVNGSGAIVVGSGRVVDYEQYVAFDLVVDVTDTGSPPKGAWGHFNITVVDVNDLMVNSMSAGPFSTLGGSPVELYGTNMGRTDGSPAKVTMMYGPTTDPLRFTASPCRVTVANTKITCFMAAGAGARLYMSLTVDQWTITPAVVFGYTAPVVTSTDFTVGMPTTGSSSITIYGSMFGPPNAYYFQPIVTYGPDPFGNQYTAANCQVASRAQNSITCNSAPGVGTNFRWTVSVAGQQSNALTSAASYVPPVIDSISAPTLETAGGEIVTIAGISFGPAMYGSQAAPIVVTYGPGGSRYLPSCKIIGQTEVQCSSASGAGANHSWFVTVGGQTSEPSTPRTSYKPPVVTLVFGPGATGSDTAGGSIVSIQGVEFSDGASPNPMPVLNYGPRGNVFKYTARQCTLQTAHVMIVCITAPGVGRGLWWNINVDGQSVLFNASSSYGHPVVTGYSGPGAAEALTRGSQLVVLSGNNFGPAYPVEDAVDSVRYGTKFPEFGALGCRVVVDHVQITCTTAPGAGAGLVWSVIIAGLESVVPVTSYAPPVVLGFRGAGAVGASTDGGQVIEIIGQFFGPPPSSKFLEKVGYGPNGVVLYDATPGCVVVSHEKITCLMLPGIGSVLKWFVTVRGQTNAMSPAFSSYAPPVINSITHAAALTPAGGVKIVLDGYNFGLLDPRVNIRVTFAGAPVIASNVYAAMNNVTLSSYAVPIFPVRAVQVLESAYAGGFITNDTRTWAEAGLNSTGDGGMVKMSLIVNSTTQGTKHTQEVLDTNGVDIRLLITTFQLFHEVTFVLPMGEGCCKPVFFTAIGPASTTDSPTFTLDYEVPMLTSMSANTAPCSWSWMSNGTRFSGASQCVNFVLAGAYLGRENTVQVSLADSTGTTYNLTTAGLSPLMVLANKMAGTPVLDCAWVSFESITCDFIYFNMYNGGSPSGWMFIADTSGRRSAAKLFSNFAPQFPAARVAALQQISYNTDGTGILGDSDEEALEGANIGNRTNVYIDGKKCVNVPPHDPKARFLYLMPLSPLSINDDTLKGKQVGRVKCVVPVGYGGRGSIRVYNDNEPNEIKPHQMYISPTISCIVPGSTFRACPDTPVPIRPSTDGRTIVTIIGQNFGNWAKVQQQCSDNATVPLSVCLDSQQCQLTGGVTCSAKPRVASAVAFPPGVAHVVPPLGFVMVIGEPDTEALVRVWDHTRIVFDVPVGAGSKRSLSIGVGLDYMSSAYSIATPSVVFSYAPPTVYSVTIVGNAGAPYRGTNIGRTEGGQKVLLVGANFGTFKPNRTVITVQFCRAPAYTLCRPCTITNPATDVLQTSIVCTSPSWVGDNLFVRVTVSDQDNSGTDIGVVRAMFNYRVPEILAMNLTHAPTGARSPVTVTGTDFGANSPLDPLYAFVRGYDAAEFDPPNTHIDRPATVVFRSHNRTVFMLPEGVGSVNDVFVMTGNQRSAMKLITQFRYDPPTIMQMDEFVADPRKNRLDCCNTDSASNLDSSGASSKHPYQATIHGDSFGNTLHPPRVFIQRWSATAPPPPLPTLPLWSVGYVDDSHGWPRAWLECKGVAVTNHKMLTCTMPSGIGANLTVGVFVGGAKRNADLMVPVDRNPARTLQPQTNQAPYIFSYDLPTIDRMQPDPADADGGPIKLYGINFGSGYYRDYIDDLSAFPPYIAIGNMPCVSPGSPEDMFVPPGVSEGYLTCTAQRHTVGYKNMTISIAAQTTYLSEDWSQNQKKGLVFTFESYCEVGKYGSDNELCVLCPPGANCGECLVQALVCAPAQACPLHDDIMPDGTIVTRCRNPLYNEPYAQVGWWGSPLPTQVAGAPNMLCSPERASRAFCPFFIPCQPKESCTGNNTCAPAYTGNRCAACAPRFYRMDGVCKPCPQNPWLLVMGFVGIALLAVCFGYVMNKKNMHLAFISIGVDYFQVLAMFGRAKVPWPPLIAQIFTYLQFFNVNLELTAPECTFPKFTFVNKWFSIEGLPMGAFVFLALMYAVLYLHKRIILGRRKRLHTHADAMVGSAFSIMYYLYLYITRTTLDIFNCTTTTPSDGHEYLSVVFEECGVPGGTQMQLLPWAVCALAVYSIGFTAACLAMLYRNSALVMEDQILRCYRLGDTRVSNPHAYSLRKRFHKLYYHYKPEFWYWRVGVLVRKFCIAFTSLMFQKNVTFQMSCLIFVIIVAYALQVKYNPYMSPARAHEVIRDHEDMIAAGHPVHVRISSEIERVLNEQARANRVKKANRWHSKRVSTEAAAAYFIDYNTVEAILLYCCILVTLAAIMFTSVELEPLAESTKALETNLLTVVTLFVIFGSMVYFLCVLGAEAYVTFYPELAAARKAKAEEAKLAKESAGGLTAQDSQVRYAVGEAQADNTVGINPLFARAASQGGELNMDEILASGAVPNEAAWGVIRASYEQMQADFGAAKRRIHELELRSNFGGAVASAPVMKKKQVFAPQRASERQKATSHEGTGDSGAAAAVSVDDTGATAVAAAPQELDDPTLPEPWIAALDPSSGKVYYVNLETNGTSWVRPA